MRKLVGQKWIVILFLVATGTAFAGMVYWLIFAMNSPDPYWIRSAEASTVAGNKQASKTDRVQYLNLKKNEEKKIGKIRIGYKGLVGGNIEIDLVIPQLDPNSSYRYRIPIREAKKGFSLFEQPLTLITARKGRIRLSIPPNQSGY